MPSTSLRPPTSAAASKRAANLHLPGLPRFHPANYPTASRAASASTTSSNAASPPSDPASPAAQQTMSSAMGASQRPQYHSRQYSDAQRKLHAYQREVMTRNYYGTPFGSNSRPQTPGSPAAGDTRPSPRSPLSPRGPHLHPLGSPGPVTPLELEGEHDSYLFSGSTSKGQLSEEAKDQILESYLQKEGSSFSSPRYSSQSSQSGGQHNAAASFSLQRGDPASHRSALSR